MKITHHEFQTALEDLRQTLSKSLAPYAGDERGRLLAELMENQLKGADIFYRLRLSEAEQRLYVDEEEFDAITGKYRAVLRFFTRLPKSTARSTYNMSVISDIYYILRFHSREWGADD